eukprot:Opistho-2@64559
MASSDDDNQQADELMVLESIFGDGPFSSVEEDGRKGGKISVVFENGQLPERVTVRMNVVEASAKPTPGEPISTPTKVTATADAGAELKLDDVHSVTEPKKRVVERILQYVPPIVLHFYFPENYPSARAPEYTLTCSWLTPTQLSRLCAHLDGMWTPGSVVVFEWVQWIQETAVAFLGITSPIQLRVPRKNAGVCLDTEQSGTPRSNVCPDARAVQDAATVTALLQQMVEYDRRRTEELLSKGEFTCEVCYADKPGAQCFQFAECRHIYCRECVSMFFTTQINDGLVTRLRCPSTGCTSIAAPHDVKSLVTPDLYQKYDRLLLQQTLNEMGCVYTCPRKACQSVVLCEKEQSMAVCGSCGHAFCNLCDHAWHGVSPCLGALTGVLELYAKAGREERARLEKRYGAKRLREALEDRETRTWMTENSKPCPSCRTAIEKNDGCNKMECTKCHAYFCWLCMRLVNKSKPYEHYAVGKCSGRLFEGVDVDNFEEFDEWDEDDGEAWHDDGGDEGAELDVLLFD